MPSRTRKAALAGVGVICITLSLVASAGAAFPGQNGGIAFDRYTSGNPEHGDILVAKSDGTCCRNLTPHSPNHDDFEASYSPSGKRIVWVRDTGVWLMHADGSHKRQLVASGNSPGFSPDGKKVVYLANSGDLHVIRSDGTHKHSIGVAGFDPSWSPNGKWIAYATATSDVNIYKVHPNGNGATPLATTTNGEVEPDWSPDGRQIAYERDNPSTFGDIYLMKATGGNQHPVAGADTGVLEVSPVFSPNGHRIAFGLQPVSSTDRDIYTVPASGGMASPVTETPAFDDFPTWQPR